MEKEMIEMENSIILEEILEELTENAKHISSSSLEKFANEIIKARHIFVAGAGRSGFVARGFANRLMHLGLEVFFVGEPTTPAIEKKDLLEELYPHISKFILICFRLLQSQEFFLCKITQIVFAVLWVHTGNFAVIVNDHPVF